MSKLVISYLRKEAKLIGLYLGGIGIFYMVLFLYNVKTEGIRYAAILAGTLLIGVLLIDFIRYCRHFERVSEGLAGIPDELRELPEAKDEVEELYQERIREQRMHSDQLESEMRIGRQDMLDYYSLWAHQIKTPIAAMRLLVQEQESTDLIELMDMHTEGLQNIQVENLQNMQDEFLRSLKMELFKTEQYVEMVLSYLRMEDMSSDLLLQWYPLDDIVRQAIKKYSALFIMKKIRLDYHKCDGMVLTDEKWLVFVLEQLLSNALKYTPQGIIKIYQEEGENGQLVIEDTGIGIQAEDLPRIFEKGFTGYNGRKDKKSTGIGLYLCKSILRKLNHEITVESEVGKGSRVYLGLKRQPRVME